MSYAALFDPGVSGFIGILPDSTAGLLRFKCVLTVIVVLMMVSALKPVYVGWSCHTGADAMVRVRLEGARVFWIVFLVLVCQTRAQGTVHTT